MVLSGLNPDTQEKPVKDMIFLLLRKNAEGENDCFFYYNALILCVELFIKNKRK